VVVVVYFASGDARGKGGGAFCARESCEAVFTCGEEGAGDVGSDLAAGLVGFR
jgi:hypothetical protein